MRRSTFGVLVVVLLAAGIGAGAFAGRLVSGSPAATQAAAVGTPVSSNSPSPSPSDSPGPVVTDSPSPSPTDTPAPTPVLVADPLDGVMVSPDLANRHVVAVMIDDLDAARPQSGLSRASIVWQAPAEGGIPRYMALFSEGDPPAVGPVRSARYYFIAWASEWDAVYVHSGGSPQAFALLHSSQGRGSVVYDADEFRWGGSYLWRIRQRPSPHNVYTDGKHLRALVTKVGAKALVTYAAHWQFAADAPIDQRPVGGSIVVPYPQNTITYAYDQASNTYLRSVSVEGRQVDAGTGERIAPKNVVVMDVSFAPLNDGSAKQRLEAKLTGSGVAYIATNGVTVKGTWRKASLAAPTLLFGPDGTPVILTVGQTFVNVVPLGTVVTFKAGTPAPAPAPSPSASPSPSPSDTPSASPQGDLTPERIVA